MINNILKLLILKLSSEKEISTSYYFDKVFLKLGIITQIGDLIDQLENNGLLTHKGLFVNEDSIYKSVSTTERGIKYFDEEIKKIKIPEVEFSQERQILLKKYLGLMK